VIAGNNASNMKIQKLLVMAGVGAALCLGSNSVSAQGFGGGRFDPAQMRQRMMENIKNQLEIKSDDDWQAIQPLVQNVMQARMEAMRAQMGRPFGFGGPRRFRMRGGNNPGQAQPQAQGQRPRRRFGPPPSPEAEALQKAIDAKAPAAELKAAMAKFVEARNAKEQSLKTAQAKLREVLTPRQEAIATLDGLL
jgi:hypothetical protein